MEISRRIFIRNMIALGFTAASAKALFSLLACSHTDIPAITPAPSGTSSPLPLFSSTSSPQPSSTASTLPVSTPSPHLPPSPTSGSTYLAVARGESPAAMVNAAIKSLGGIKRFVKTGDDVIIKPNICVAYHSYEYAATTNPEVIGTLTALCLEAGARRVRVMDQPFGGTAAQAYTRSGIDKAVHAAGGKMEEMSRIKYRDVPVPEGRDIKNWQVYGDVLDADVLINAPIAKHHSLARLTLGMKNLMGIILNRNKFHSNLGQRVADLTSLVRPTLTVVDAVRILMNHGPSGGNLNDVKLANTVIASHDVVAADAYATTLFGLTGADIPIIRAAAEMGLGTMDLRSVKVEEINV